jgi:hypothetical protein
MFVGSPMNIKATWQSRPAMPALRGPTDEHKELKKTSCFVCLLGWEASKTGINKQIYNI